MSETPVSWKIPLTEPELGEEEIQAVTRVLTSGWLTMGPVTAEFERQFAEKMQVKHAIAVNNCTAALHLANLALKIGPGDEVICPALTFVATANATRYTGAQVVFADVISARDLTIDPQDIARKITPRTRAITVMHYAGFLCRMDEILALARQHGLKVIEDCAHAPFTFLPAGPGHAAPRFAGAFGDVGCFSFFGNKNMTTGEGGMLTTNDGALAQQLRLLRSHGMTSLTYDRHKGHASGYDVIELGYNYRMDEIHAAIGLCQLARLDRLHASRRQVYGWYVEEASHNPRLEIAFSERSLEGVSCHILPAIVQGDVQQVREKLKGAGIQTSKHYDLIPSFSIYGQGSSGLKFQPDHLITLPLSPVMTHEQVAWIISLI